MRFLGPWIGRMREFVRGFTQSLSSLSSRLRPPRLTLILLAISFGTVGLWFSGPNYLYFLDEIFPFNPSANLAMYGGAWNPLFNMGDPMPFSLTLLPFFYYVKAMHVFSVPLWLAQYLWYASLFFIGALGAARAAWLALGTGSKPTFMGLAAALVYSFNPVSAVIVYPNGAPLLNALFAFLPWVYVFYRRGIANATLTGVFPVRDFALAVVCSVPTLMANIPFNLSFFVVIFGAGIYAVRVSRCTVKSIHWKTLVPFLLGVPVLAILINGWWILPQYVYASNLLGNANPTTFFQVERNRQIWISGTDTAAIPSLLGLAGFPNWGWQWVNALYVGSSPFLLLGLGFPLVIFSAALVASQKCNRREWAFHAIAVLALVAVMSGTNSPFAPLLSGILDNQVAGQLLRLPWFPFSAAYTLFVSILLSLSLQALWNHSPQLGATGRSATPEVPSKGLWRIKSQRSWRIVIFAVTVTLAVIYAFPLWTGQFVPNNPVSGRVSVPQYVIETAEFLKARVGSSHVLILPPGECLELSNWSSGYIGQSILGLLSGVPTIYSSCRNAGGTQRLLDLAYKIPETDLSPSNYSNLLAMLSVKYIVVRWDAGGPFGTTFPNPNPSHISWFLHHQPGISFVTQIGEYEIFQNDRSLPPVFTSSSGVTSQDTWAYQNITSTFYNKSVVPIGGASFATVFPRWQLGEIVYERSLLNYSGGPLIAMNSIPLNANTSLYGFLRVTFATDPSTAIKIMASSTQSFTHEASIWSGDPIPLLAQGAEAFSLGHAWPNWYKASRPATLVFDLRSLQQSNAEYPVGSSISPLNYLTIVLWHVVVGEPTFWADGQEWTPKLTVSSIQIGGYSPYMSLGEIVTPPDDNVMRNLTVQMNFTQQFVASAAANGPSRLNSTMTWTYNPVIGIAARYNHSLGPYAILVNHEPLGLNTTAFPFLAMELRAGPDTSVVIMASSSRLLNESSLWTGDPNPLMATNSELGWLSRTWPNWYEGGSNVTLVFDLRHLVISSSYYPPGTSLSILNYVAFVMYQVSDDTPVFGPVQDGVTPQVTIRSLTLVQPLLSPPPIEGFSHFIGFDPFTSVIVDGKPPASLPDAASPRAILVEASPTRYVADLTVNRPDGFYITLTENYDPGWTLLVQGRSLPAVNHIEGDLYANTWYIPPNALPANSSVRVVITYSPEEYVRLGVVLSSGSFAGLSAVWFVPGIVRLRRRRARIA